jgi:tRNA (cmo5U34)-methyltransferase
MTKLAPAIAFNEEHAASYDQRFAKLAPMKDALHLLMRLIFAKLPNNARILCIGAGTGAELLYLAQAFPLWHFTALDPSAPMLNICRQHAEACGIASRCTFIEGYIDALPESESFDAATCILVSQFILQPVERRNFFSKIAEQLCRGGLLISADLAIDSPRESPDSLFEMWVRAWEYTGVSSLQLENLKSAFGRGVSVLPAQEIELLIGSSGFDTPVAFFQTLLIHAWYAKKS